MRKYYLEQDDLDAFVQVLQLPHVLPIQGPYAIKLLKALAAATKSKYGDSKALNEAAETLLKSYESFISKFASQTAQTFTTDPLGSLLLEIARVSLETDADTKLKALTGELRKTLSHDSTDIFPQNYSTAIVDNPAQKYLEAIVDYLKTIFHPTVDITDNRIPLPDHSKAPLPIEHGLIIIERDDLFCLCDSQLAQAAYDRAVTIGCALRTALSAVGAASGTQTTLINDETLTKAATTAFSLLCRAALRTKVDDDAVHGYSWAPIEAPTGLSSFVFKTEHQYYQHCWTYYSYPPDYTTQSFERLAVSCLFNHRAGAEAFLAPALHMLGCSQVAAVGNRAWPAVYQDAITLDYNSGPSISNRKAQNAAIFNSLVGLNYPKNLETTDLDIITDYHAIAARPNIIGHPDRKGCDDVVDLSSCFAINITTSADALEFFSTLHSRPSSTLQPIIPNSGAIYLCGIPKEDKFKQNVLPLFIQCSKRMINPSCFNEESTHDWILEVLSHQVDQKMFICNYFDWFHGMVEHPDQHFAPLPDCRAFRAFTDDHGSVPGYLGYKPVNIYYCNTKYNERWNFYGPQKDFNTPGVLHVIHQGTWEHPDTGEKFMCYVTPYHMHVYTHLDISEEIAGSGLAKRLLHVVGLDRISIQELMVKYVQFDAEWFFTNGATMKTARNWQGVMDVIDSLENCLPYSTSICHSLRDKRPLVAAPFYGPKKQLPLSNPGRVVGLLVWALKGQYFKEWSAPDGWKKAALSLLGDNIRPNFESTHESQNLTGISTLLMLCKDDNVSEVQSDTHDPLDSDLHAYNYYTNFTPFYATLEPLRRCSSYEQYKPQSPSTLPTSKAVMWVHLVFCVMNNTESLPNLIHHPFFFSLDERERVLVKVGARLHDDERARKVAHDIYSKLWPTDNDISMDDGVQSDYNGVLTGKSQFTPGSAPFILVRHRIIHAYDQSNVANKEVYQQKVFFDSLILYFEQFFPALELTAWLFHASGRLYPSEERPIYADSYISDIAEKTLITLGCKSNYLSTNEVNVNRIASNIDYTVTEEDDLAKMLLDQLGPSYEPWGELLRLATLPTTELLQKLTDSLDKAKVTLGVTSPDYPPLATSADIRLPACARYELLRAALSLTTMERNELLKIAKDWVDMKPTVIKVFKLMQESKTSIAELLRLFLSDDDATAVTGMLDAVFVDADMKLCLIFNNECSHVTLTKLLNQLKLPSDLSNIDARIAQSMTTVTEIVQLRTDEKDRKEPNYKNGGVYLPLSQVYTNFKGKSKTIDSVCSNFAGASYEFLRLALSLSSMPISERLKKVTKLMTPPHDSFDDDLNVFACKNSTEYDSGLFTMQSIGYFLIKTRKVSLTDVDISRLKAMNAHNIKPKTPPQIERPLGVAMKVTGPPGARALAKFAIALVRHIDSANIDAVKKRYETLPISIRRSLYTFDAVYDSFSDIMSKPSVPTLSTVPSSPVSHITLAELLTGAPDTQFVGEVTDDIKLMLNTFGYTLEVDTESN